MCKILTQQTLYSVTRRVTEFQVKRSMRDHAPYLFLHVHLISLVTNYLTNSMEKTACPITNIFWGCQKTYHILWNEEVHYHVLNIMPLVPLLNKMNSFHTHSPYFTNYFSRQIIILEQFCICFISHTIFYVYRAVYSISCIVVDRSSYPPFP